MQRVNQHNLSIIFFIKRLHGLKIILVPENMKKMLNVDHYNFEEIVNNIEMKAYMYIKISQVYMLISSFYSIFLK